MSKTATWGIVGPNSSVRGVDALQVGRVVERSEVDAFLDTGDDRLVDAGASLEPLGAVDHAVADRVDVGQAGDAFDPRVGRGHPLDGVGQRRLVVAQRGRAFDRRVIAHLEGDDRLAADPFDQALGELPVAILLDQVGIGFDDLELEGRTAAVEDEYVHDGTLGGEMKSRLF